MLTWSRMRRMVQIQRVLVKYSLDDLIATAPLLKPLRLLFLIGGRRMHRDEPLAVRIRLALEELGPIFIKLGQTLSTRRDLLPPDIAAELAKLQDQVPPFDGKLARKIINDAYGFDLSEVFDDFDETPMAAASIAQVHPATLKDGTKVVVKVLRPGMRDKIRRDLDVMYVMAELADRYLRDGKRLRPVEVVQEYDKTIMDELDLMREAANGSQLRRNFEYSDKLYVPEVYFDYCRVEVLVLERIYGVHISNMEALLAANTNIKKLAENGVEIFFTQVFRHNFFHADMHPGNIFVRTDDPDNPMYQAIDFGIIGTLNVKDQQYLAENFLAFFDRDYHRVAQLHVDSGWVPPYTRVEELESAVRTVCEPIFNKPLAEISFGQVLLRLFETARRFEMEVQPQLILLQKTLLNIEGLGRDLYPELDLFDTAAPILREWMEERLGGRAVINDFKTQWPEVRETLRELPTIMRRIGEQAANGELRVTTSNGSVDALREEMRADAKRRYWQTLSIACAGGGGALLLWSTLAPAFGWAAIAAGIVGVIGTRPR
ncbi:MAG: ubiquinone biosynthesis regulatory protein kinase UbiB [Pseudomonadota bacterium]